MANSAKPQTSELPECFVIMPIGKTPDDQKHFDAVLKCIIEPACAQAGYRAVRADKEGGTSLIHVDILTRLLHSPMAICDLSRWNPNVLFELGFRQAFDKPVVLIQEEGTERVFDTAVLKNFDYRKGFDYQQVQEDQQKLAEAIKQTGSPTPGTVNSLVELLKLTPARLAKGENQDHVTGLLQVIHAEILSLKGNVRALQSERSPNLLDELKEKAGQKLASLEFHFGEFTLDTVEAIGRAETKDELNQLANFWKQIKRFTKIPTKADEMLESIIRNRESELADEEAGGDGANC